MSRGYGLPRAWGISLLMGLAMVLIVAALQAGQLPVKRCLLVRGQRCSMSAPTMLAEVVVRVGYALKSLHEGTNLKDTLSLSTDRFKNQKLGTMLFIAHTLAAAINAEKVYFSRNPMAINYPQWIAFSKYAFQQAKWVLINKSELRDTYVLTKISSEMDDIYDRVNASFSKLDAGCVIL